MLKSILCFSVCFFVITLPSFAQLMQQDLNEIRLIVKEEVEKAIEKEIEPIKAEIASIRIEIASVKGEVARVQDKLDRFGSDIIWAIAMFAVAIILQRIIAWHKRRLRLQDEQIQEKKTQAELRAEIEKLKQQRTVNP